MRSPRVEGPPVLQPVVGESSTVAITKEPETAAVEAVLPDEPSTPPMPILIVGEDYDDNDDASSFEVLDEINADRPVEASKSAGKSPPTSLTNGIIDKDRHEFKPLLEEFPKIDKERVNGDHEEPVLEKFFRLYTPSTQDVIQSDAAVDDILSGKLNTKSDNQTPEATVEASLQQSPAECPKSPNKRRRVSRKSSPAESPSPKRSRKTKDETQETTKAGRRKKNDLVTQETAAEDEESRPKSPQLQNRRGRRPGSKKTSPAKPGRKPLKKDKGGKETAQENHRYLRSPYIVSTSENDSIVSRFQVVNPALRDASAVNILDHPFKHSVKVVPVATLAIKPWVCVFCGHGTSFNELGCLFGPYFIDVGKLNLPVGLIYPLDTQESAPPEPVQSLSSPPPPPPRPPSPEQIEASPAPSPPSSPKPSPPPSSADDSQPAESDNRAVSEATSEVLSETLNEPNPSASSCPKTRSGRRSIRKFFDDDYRPSSISSFRNSKARSSQPIIVAQDIRKNSEDSGKKSKGVKQIDIAAMFFSSEQKIGDKSSVANGCSDKSKRVSSRRKSEPQATQVYEELTRKFKLKLDRTDAIPKKNQVMKREKSNLLKHKEPSKEESKVETSKSVKEVNAAESTSIKQSDVMETDSKKILSAKKKPSELEKKNCDKIDSYGAVKKVDSTKKQKNSVRGRKRTTVVKPTAKSTIVSAKRVAKAKLETAKQTAKAKQSKGSKTDSQASEVNARSVVESAKRRRGRRPKSASKTEEAKGPDLPVKPLRVRQRPVKPEPKIDYDDSRLSSNGEVWFHMECVLWTSGTYLNGKIVVGLEETLNVALQAICNSCNKRGAMLACVQRGCDKTYHFYCAVKAGSYLDNEQFCIYCAKHKAKILLSKLAGRIPEHVNI